MNHVTASGLAGDSATTIMKSGAVLTIINGYNQLVFGMPSLKSTGVHNYPAEIENTSFYANLGEVLLRTNDPFLVSRGTVVRSDTCSAEKRQSRGDLNRVRLKTRSV